jgi:hypothetical protein
MMMMMLVVVFVFLEIDRERVGRKGGKEGLQQLVISLKRASFQELWLN